MSKYITLGTVKVPIENYATQANAILGIKGSGKTTTAKGIAEQLLDAGVPIIVLDPVGMWRYLKVPKEKGGKAYKVVVAGGQAGDLPLTPHTAPEIVRSAIRSNIPLVIDLYDIKLSKADWRRIVKSTAEILMFENKGIRHLFLEEASEYIPQIVKDGDLFAAVEKLCRMGGNASVGITLINPRAQEVNKAVLELCELLILMRQKGKHALAALDKWLSLAQDTKDVSRTLANFGAGEAFVWPESADPVRTQFPPCVTFHPDRKRPDLPKGSMPEDVSGFVGELKESLTKVIEEAKANDPVELKKQLAIAKREHADMVREIERLKKTGPAKPVEVEKRVEVSVLSKDDLAEWQTLVDMLLEEHWKLEKLLVDAQQQVETFAGKLSQVANRPLSGVPAKPTRHDRVAIQRSPRAMPARRAASSNGESGPLPKGEAAILTAIAQHGGCSREQLTVLTGYKRSSRDTYLQRLGEKQFTDNSGDLIQATEDGIQALGPDFAPLPTGNALRDHWLQRLPLGERAILEILIFHYPNGVSRDNLSEMTGYQRSSRDTYLQRLGARMLIESDRGTVRASKILFDE